MTTVYKQQSKMPEKKGQIAKTSRMRVFTSFARNPQNVRFETQESQETVELFLRQHPIVNIPWILLSIVLILAPTIVFPIIFHALPIQLPVGYMVVATAFWYLATFGFVLTNFLHWFFNIYIVTNERIIDIDFKFLLYKHFSEAEHTKIQDISFTSSGIGATLFNYGNVNVQTAGETPTLEFEIVPHPQQVVETIRNLAEKIHSL
jgi:uncharacterized membrane protein YdbT with pleckstrin-like domain